jgi:hypothetical protein
VTGHQHRAKHAMAHGFYVGQKVGLAPTVSAFPKLRALLERRRAGTVRAICECRSIKVERPNERRPERDVTEWWAAELWRPAARGRAA